MPYMCRNYIRAGLHLRAYAWGSRTVCPRHIFAPPFVCNTPSSRQRTHGLAYVFPARSAYPRFYVGSHLCYTTEAGVSPHSHTPRTLVSTPTPSEAVACSSASRARRSCISVSYPATPTPGASPVSRPTPSTRPRVFNLTKDGRFISRSPPGPPSCTFG